MLNKDAIGKNQIAELFFWMAVVCELVVSFSGYAFGGYKEPWIIILGLGFSGLSILFSMDLKQEWKILAICGFVGLGFYWLQKTALILRIIMLLLAGRYANRRKVIGFFFWGTLTGMLYAGILAALGMHNSLSITQLFRQEVETRYCFGFYHPNGFSLFFFRMIAMGLYVYGEKMKNWLLAMVGIISLAIMALGASKAGIATLFLTFAGFFVIRIWKKEGWEKRLAITGAVLMVVEILFILGSMIWFCPSETIYGEGQGFWQLFNEITTGRLYKIHETFIQYPIPLWGYRGFMEATEVGFVNALYNQGIVFFILYLGALFYAFYRMYREKDMSALVVIMAFTLYAMAEAFLPYANKNGIWLFLIGWKQKENISKIEQKEELIS